MSHTVYAWDAKALGKTPTNLEQISKDFAHFNQNRFGQPSTQLVSFTQALASEIPEDNAAEWENLYAGLDNHILDKGLILIALDLPNQDWILGLKIIDVPLK